MKILIIRHGDPDYAIDSLTEKGWKEAQLLAERISALNISRFYVSPLGRAKDTASVTLRKMNREAEVLPWLREFHAPVTDPVTGQQSIPWDMLPGEWTAEHRYYDKDQWMHVPLMSDNHVGEEAAKVAVAMDALLAHHGYLRQGQYYQAVAPHNDTLVFFCHFGVECVLLGHLLGISPVVLWHGFCAAPSSVTTVVTEERRAGIAGFRLSAFGDISHLYAGGEPPAFAARFCETFANMDERHD